MKRFHRAASVALAAALGAGLLAASAQASPRATRAADARHAVFVQTNDPSGNRVIAYERGAFGGLHEVRSYATGGDGGTTMSAPLDALASQGSLTYDAGHRLLFAVNAGSDTFTVFGVHGATLDRRQVLSTRGSFPVSVTVRGDLVYVLNAGDTGSVSGYRIVDGSVRRIRGAVRSLGLANTNPPFFLSAPAQVGLTPDGAHLVVTTKNANTIDVFTIHADGRPSAAPVQNASSGAVPFAFSFDAAGRLLVVEASGGASSYAFRDDGTLRTLSASVSNNGQAAACWSTTARGFLYVVNAGSNTITGYRENDHGRLRLLDASGVTATTDAGPIDAATSGRFVYVQNAVAGTLGGYRVRADGSLRRIVTVTGLPAFNGTGMEGIAAS